MPPICPGLLSATDCAVLNAAIELAEDTHRVLTGRAVQIIDEFPARITAWDAGKQRASWTEEYFDTNGQRAEKTAALGGRSGTSTYMWAAPVGNGLMPPNELPLQVWLRRRLVATDATSGDSFGPVYEFDFVCACAGSGSGSGSGAGTGVLTGCCPGAVPQSLTATFTQTAGAACALNGASAAMTYDGTGSTWHGSATVGGKRWDLSFDCTGGAWTVGVSNEDAACLSSFVGGSTDSCTPLHVTAAGFATDAGCAVCPSATFTVTVTE